MKPLKLMLPMLLLSGMCALTYQVAWMREFRLIFGGTTAANGAVLAIFMGGLGLGNLLLGKRADATLYPLRLYALLELVIVVSAVVSPLLIYVIGQVYIALGGQATMGTFVATVVRLLLAALVLAVPTIAMGGTLPAAARFVTTQHDERRRSLGFLYGVNTLGAVLGPIACTFFLLEHFGTRWTIWIAALVNFGIVVIVSLVASRSSAAIVEPNTSDEPSRKRTGTSELTASWIYTASAVIGFAFFTMELVWYRMLGPLLGGSTYTLGLILAIALAGIGVGAALYPLIFRYVRPTPAAFAITCLLEAAFIAFPFALGDRLANVALQYRQTQANTFAELIFGWIVVTAIVILPAALVSGVQFPLLIALLGRGRRDVGQQTGRAFACNTLGAIVGSLLGGFWILPALTAPGAWMVVVALLLMLGVAATMIALREKMPTLATASCLVLFALATWEMTRVGPTAFWRHSGIGAGRGTADIEDLDEVILASNEELVWEAEGREACVALMNRGDGGLAFFVNGKSDGSAVGDASTQVMFPMLGALLHPHPTSALVIGLGTGESAGWLAEVESIPQVDVVEIEPVIHEVALRCETANQNVLRNPKVEVIYNDARELMLTSTRMYDLIISEPSNPYRAGVANLFTAEFYESVNTRLNEGGIFIQWLQAYEVDSTAVAMVLNTLREKFPYVEIWTGEPADLVLVCSHEPIHSARLDLAERASQPIFKQAAQCTWQESSLEGILSHYLAGQKTVDAFRAQNPAPIVTDDRNALEYSMARSVGKQLEYQSHKLRSLALDLDDWKPATTAQVDWDLVDEHWYYWHGQIDGKQQTGPRQTRMAALEQFPEFPDRTIADWHTQPRDPKLFLEVATLAQAYAVMSDERALPLIEQVRKLDPLTADLILAEYKYLNHDPNGAAILLEEVFTKLHETPWVRQRAVSDGLTLIGLLAQSGHPDAPNLIRLIETPFAVYFMDEQRRATCQALGR